jgi:hypothetical protein
MSWGRPGRRPWSSTRRDGRAVQACPVLNQGTGTCVSRPHRRSQISALAGSEEWIADLRFVAAFRRYSFCNVVLIAAQCPHVAYVAGYRTWQDLGTSCPPSTAPTSPWTGSPAGSPPRDGGCELPLSGTCEGHTDYERRLIASEPASNPQPAWSCCCTRPRTPSRTGISPRASTTSIAGSARPKQNPPPTCSPTCSTSNSTPARSATWPAGPRPTRPCSPQRQQCAARSQSRAAQLRAPRSVPVVLPRGSATKHCVERSPSSHAPWCGSYHPRP